MSVPHLPEQFFTLETLASASGCGLVVYVIVNGFRSFIGFFAKWLFLAVSIVIVFGLYYASGQPWGVLPVIVLIANTFLVAFAALGLQEGTVRGVTRGTDGQQFSFGRKKWLSSWLD